VLSADDSPVNADAIVNRPLNPEFRIFHRAEEEIRFPAIAVGWQYPHVLPVIGAAARLSQQELKYCSCQTSCKRFIDVRTLEMGHHQAQEGGD
jgi:hypothetical protein